MLEIQKSKIKVQNYSSKFKTDLAQRIFEKIIIIVGEKNVSYRSDC
jgi:hypothetical protein